METIKELTFEESNEINGGVVDPISAASLALAALWCCYELGAACAAYDQRHP